MSSDESNQKRQRVSRACDHCRKKKIKCDGLSPICSNCQAFHLDCSYKDTTKKRGPPKGYIEAIENKLYKLELYLNDIVKKEDKDPRVMELLKELQAPLETPNGVTINDRPQRRQRRNKQNVNEKNTPISPLFNSPPLTHSDLQFENLATTGASSLLLNDTSLSIDEHGQVRYLDNSSGFYLSSDTTNYKSSVFPFTGYCDQMIPEQESLDTKNKANSFNVPSHDLSKHLVDLYLEHFYPVLPMFYKKTFSSCTNPLEPVSPLLLNAIYAIASRVSPDVNIRSDPNAPETAGHFFYERARCLLDDCYDTPEISTVQALLLMASYQMGVMKPAKAWLYSGMAFRMAQDLGLNRNCDNMNIPTEERERRKRVFWCCYIVDRQMSAIYGRQSSFDDRDCDVPFPSVDDDELIISNDRPPARLLDIFIETIKISDLLGHVLETIYYAKAKHRTDSRQTDRLIGSLHQQLIRWHSRLPPSIQYKIPNTQSGEKVSNPPAAIGQLHFLYYTTLILLHRSFIPGPKQTQIPMSLPSYKICELASTFVLDIATIMMNEDRLRFVQPYAVFSLFTAGTIFIKLSSSSDPNRAFDAKINASRVMKALDELEQTWTNASRSRGTLGELREADVASPSNSPHLSLMEHQWKPTSRRSASDFDPSLFSLPQVAAACQDDLTCWDLNDWNTGFGNFQARVTRQSSANSSVEFSTSPSQSMLLGLQELVASPIPMDLNEPNDVLFW